MSLFSGMMKNLLNLTVVFAIFLSTACHRIEPEKFPLYDDFYPPVEKKETGPRRIPPENPYHIQNYKKPQFNNDIYKRPGGAYAPDPVELTPHSMVLPNPADRMDSMQTGKTTMPKEAFYPPQNHMENHMKNQMGAMPQQQMMPMGGNQPQPAWQPPQGSYPLQQPSPQNPPPHWPPQGALPPTGPQGFVAIDNNPEPRDHEIIPVGLAGVPLTTPAQDKAFIDPPEQVIAYIDGIGDAKWPGEKPEQPTHEFGNVDNPTDAHSATTYSHDVGYADESMELEGEELMLPAFEYNNAPKMNKPNFSKKEEPKAKPRPKRPSGVTKFEPEKRYMAKRIYLGREGSYEGRTYFPNQY